MRFWTKASRGTSNILESVYASSATRERKILAMNIQNIQIILMGKKPFSSFQFSDSQIKNVAELQVS